MAEAVGLPQSDQFGIALDDFAVHRQIRLWLRLALGEMHGQHVLGENLLLFGLLGVVEVFEVAKAYVALGQAQQHRPALLLFTPYRGVRADHAQRATARNAQGVQGFGGQELTDRGAQHGAAVAHARVWGLPGALEVQVPVLARVVVHFAQQQAAAIAQARVVGTELMPGIDHCPRLGLGPEFVPAEQFGEHIGLRLAWIEVEQLHGGIAGHHQARVEDGLWQHRGGKRIAQAGEAVVESQFVQLFQRAVSGQG
ncbi:hypothetical protein D3C80_1193400 [compost metagenome]